MTLMLHFFCRAAGPDLGGMEQSVARISGLLAMVPGWRVRIYTRSTMNNSWDPGAVEVRPLGDQRAFLAAPSADTTHRHRLDYLLFRNSVEQAMSESQVAAHAIVSFDVCNNGFVAQRVADSLNLPHIASVRGTDFSADFFDPSRFARVEHVLRRAAFVVTTNREQEETIRRSIQRTSRLQTIYNSFPHVTKLPYWHHTPKSPIRLVCTSGYFQKKGTHLLLRAAAEMIDAGADIQLTVIGRTEEETAPDYWDTLIADYVRRYGTRLQFHGWVPADSVPHILLAVDIFCSSTLGEGCSNARLLALAMGLPIVSTSCGEILDFAAGARHVRLAKPGDYAGFVSELRQMVQCIEAGTIVVDRSAVDDVRRRLDSNREADEWRDVVQKAVLRSRPLHPRKQPRLLFYVHDGAGLGHLQRIAKLAKSLQGPMASLIITGHRAAAWMVSEACEYVHIPSYDTLDRNKSVYWGREPFVDMTMPEVRRLRESLLRATVESYRPDAIIVDYFPGGKNGEMEGIVGSAPARKYLLWRGVLAHPDHLQREVLGERGEEVVARDYNKVLVACDRLVCDVAQEYSLGKEIAEKLVYVGYISTPIVPYLREQVRRARGLDGRKWIVCSAGGGMYGERLLEECERLAARMPHYGWDIVVGPRSNCERNFLISESLEADHVRWSRRLEALPLMHAAADVVVCSGGYNSLLEASEGDARIVCFPTNLTNSDEQFIHASRLRAFRPIEIVTNIEELGDAVEQCVQDCGPPVRLREALNMNGIENIRSILASDLAGNVRGDVSGDPAVSSVSR